MSWIVLLVAHGTVESTEDLPAFLNEIRRGRPAPPELLEELVHRYDAVGGSPLLRLTNAQAAAVGKKLNLEARVAMRLWDPRVGQVLADINSDDQVCMVPLAPFSVDVYREAAIAELEKSPTVAASQLHCVPPWGEHPELIQAYVDQIQQTLKGVSGPAPCIVLTAHSLPMRAIQAGDQYEAQFRATAKLVSNGLGLETKVCFQSQGEVAGAWLGPDLPETLTACHQEGHRSVVIAPIGFLAEHIETLYDLDIETRQQCEQLGLAMHRVPALDTHPGLVQAMVELVKAVIEQNGAQPIRQI